MFAVALIPFALAGTMQPAHARVCLQLDMVRFTAVHLRFEVSGKAVQDRILVKVPIDCKTDGYRIPKSLREGIELLDMALPLEYKLSALKGTYLNTYKYGDFAVSAERDLGTFFSQIWKLDDASFCKAVDPKDPENQRSTCFMKILDAWRAGYRGLPESSSEFSRKTKK